MEDRAVGREAGTVNEKWRLRQQGNNETATKRRGAASCQRQGWRIMS
jgi:hypothetical protein